MALARFTTQPSSGDILTAAAYNGELNNILNNANSLISPFTGNVDINNKQLTNLVLELPDSPPWMIRNAHGVTPSAQSGTTPPRRAISM